MMSKSTMRINKINKHTHTHTQL